MQARIFVSCSSRDSKAALAICNAIEARGYSCWLASRDVGPGQNFQVEIVRAIRAAPLMVLVFSANADNSNEIKKEVAVASQSNLTVIPVRIEDVTPSEAFVYEFSTRQWIDVFGEWERSMQILLQHIAAVMPVAPMPEPVAAPEPPAVTPRQPEPAKAADPVPQTPARDSVGTPRPFLARHGKPLVMAAGLLLVLGAGVAAFVFQKPSGPARTAPAAKAVAEQRALVESVQQAHVAAIATANRALAAQTKARETAQQAEAAAKRAEAGTAGYGLRTGQTDDGDGTWQWKGQVAADRWPNGVGIFSIISGYSKGTRYAGEMHNHARNGSGVGTSVLSSMRLNHYEGEWRDDKLQGAGVMTLSEQEKIGQWVNNGFISGVLRNSSGTGTTPDGTRWTGTIVWFGSFKAFDLDGYGGMYDLYGHLLEGGLYENGKLKTALTAASRAAVSSSPAAAPKSGAIAKSIIAASTAQPVQKTSFVAHGTPLPVPGNAPVGPQAQQAADAGRAAEKQARAAQAKAQAVAQQAEAAAKQAEAGAAGYGTLTGRTGDSDWRWEGQVANNNPEGLGVHSFTNGSFKDVRYAGEMHNGFEEGVGIEIHPGSRYEGEWRNGFEEGAGVMTTNMGYEQAGQWLRDEMVSGKTLQK